MLCKLAGKYFVACVSMSLSLKLGIANLFNKLALIPSHCIVLLLSAWIVAIYAISGVLFLAIYAYLLPCSQKKGKGEGLERSAGPLLSFNTG